MHKRGYSRHAVSVCVSVRPSVTFVDYVKTNYDIFEIFSPSGSHAILVFIIIIIIIITDLYSAFRSEDTEALGAAQED